MAAMVDSENKDEGAGLRPGKLGRSSAVPALGPA